VIPGGGVDRQARPTSGPPPEGTGSPVRPTNDSRLALTDGTTEHAARPRGHAGNTGGAAPLSPRWMPRLGRKLHDRRCPAPPEFERGKFRRGPEESTFAGVGDRRFCTAESPPGDGTRPRVASGPGQERQTATATRGVPSTGRFGAWWPTRAHHATARRRGGGPGAATSSEASAGQTHGENTGSKLREGRGAPGARAVGQLLVRPPGRVEPSDDSSKRGGRRKPQLSKPPSGRRRPRGVVRSHCVSSHPPSLLQTSSWGRPSCPSQAQGRFPRPFCKRLSQAPPQPACYDFPANLLDAEVQDEPAA